MIHCVHQQVADLVCLVLDILSKLFFAQNICMWLETELMRAVTLNQNIKVATRKNKTMKWKMLKSYRVIILCRFFATESICCNSKITAQLLLFLVLAFSIKKNIPYGNLCLFTPFSLLTVAMSWRLCNDEVMTKEVKLSDYSLRFNKSHLSYFLPVL